MGLFNPKDHVAGGGFLPPEGSEVTISEAEITTFSYKNSNIEATVLQITIEVSDGEEYEPVIYTCGDEPEPNKRGTNFVGTPVITKNSHFSKFMKSMVDGGFPADLLDEAEEDDTVGIKVLEGVVFKSAYLFLKKEKWTDNDGKERESDKNLLIVDKVVELPKAGKAGSKSAGKSGGGNSDLQEAVEEIIDAAFAENENLKASDLPKLLKRDDRTKKGKVMNPKAYSVAKEYLAGIQG